MVTSIRFLDFFYFPENLKSEKKIQNMSPFFSVADQMKN